ncbi:hypothetical protein A2V80_01510 [Candidatus Woesebacteria bacterium RBG_16_39_8b]|uniref:PIN domain-containing protein n=1 Tax=Candidatus Woesebacteria bacterium RBG_16_39_8b TaxID=1802482 RepID=A0A1F7XBY2_9BACT|nr:MAG: hypothetical protein A2V80_01510 [Candidatus Woesebacteria bacterium RBG_16_39_8b]
MIVVDTSVALKWLLTEKEESITKARMLLKDHLAKKNEILVPELLFYEIANALATKTKIPQIKINGLLKRIYSLNIKIYHPLEPDVLDSARLAKKYNSTVYDMLYAVVAKKHKTKLITADANFIKKTKFMFVKHLKDIITISSN